MRTPKYHPAFDCVLSSFFEGWASHPAGKAAMGILMREDSVALAIAASDAGRPALDPLQEELVATLRAEVLADDQFKRFLGNFQRRLMHELGYELVSAAVPLPEERRILLRSAATYRRAVAQAA